MTDPAERTARRSVDLGSRYLAPRDLAPRTDLAAGTALAALLVQVLLAQATLLFAICFLIIWRLSRWRPAWLVLPAAVGLGWVLAVGPRPALAGYLSCGGQVIRYLTGPGTLLAGLGHVRGVFPGWRQWLPGQVPAALIVAAAEATVIGKLGRAGRSWPYRRGLVIAARRLYLAATLRRGEVATSDGGCVGIVESTGKRAAISWREAEAGMLCTGQDAVAVTATCMDLALAAIEHRKAVIIVDLTASAQDIAGGRGRRFRPCDLVESACASAAAPLRRFGGHAGHYDPLSGAGLARATSLVLATIDWTGVSHPRQLFCANYLNTALTAIAACPPESAWPPVPLLDDLVRLLVPGELAARIRQLPVQQAGVGALAGRVGDLAGQLDADPAAVAPLATQLTRLSSAALGQWLRPASGEESIGLTSALAGREVVLFALDRRVHGRPAAMIARLAVADLVQILAEQGDLDTAGDCLVWINGCEAVDSRQLAALVAIGAKAGTAVLLGTASQTAAARLASEVNVIAVRGAAPPWLTGTADPGPGTADPGPGTPVPGSASMLGSAAGISLQTNDSAGLTEHLLLPHRPDALFVRVGGPRPRLVSGCRAVR